MRGPWRRVDADRRMGTGFTVQQLLNLQRLGDRFAGLHALGLGHAAHFQSKGDVLGLLMFGYRA